MSRINRTAYDILNDHRSSNVVIVYIWPSSITSLSSNTWISTGHAALQTITLDDNKKTTNYVSFWPKECCNKTYVNSLNPPEGKQNKCNYSTDHFHDRSTDRHLYRNTGKQFIFEKLDVLSINAEIKRFKQAEIKWSALSNPIFRDKNLQHCSGLVFQLLNLGGFSKYLDFLTRVRLSFKRWSTSGMALSTVGIPSAFFTLSNIATRASAILGTGPGRAYMESTHIATAYLVVTNPALQDQLKKARDSYFFVSQIGKILSSVSVNMGTPGLLICASLAVVSIGCIVLSLMGSGVDLLVITPENLSKLLEVAEKYEDQLYVEQSEFNLRSFS